jgi:hypothetical protein
MQGSKTFLSLGKKESIEPPFIPGMFLREGSLRILRRSSTVPVFHREKNASAYRTGSKAQPPNTTKSFKDSYQNITVGALKVCLGHLCFRVVEAVSFRLSSSTQFCIVLMFSCRTSVNMSGGLLPSCIWCIFHGCIYNGLKDDTQTSATMHGISMSWKDAATIQHYRGREMMSTVRNTSPIHMI